MTGDYRVRAVLQANAVNRWGRMSVFEAAIALDFGLPVFHGPLQKFEMGLSTLGRWNTFDFAGYAAVEDQQRIMLYISLVRDG